MATDPKAPILSQDPQTSEDPSRALEGEEEAPEGSSPEEIKETSEEEPPAEGAAPKDGEAPKALEQPGHKRQGGYARRIERLERTNQLLMEQLQRGGAAPIPPKEKTAEEKAAEQFEQLVDRRIADRDAKRETESQMQAFTKRVSDTSAKYDDWDEAIAGLNIPANSPLGQAILTSDQGPEIMYQLGKNPTELARLSSLTPFAAAREIGRMEAKVVTPGAAPVASGKRPPAPPSPVGGGSSTAVRDLSTLPISEYKREQRKRLKR